MYQMYLYKKLNLLTTLGFLLGLTHVGRSMVKHTRCPQELRTAVMAECDLSVERQNIEEPFDDLDEGWSSNNFNQCHET